MNQADYEIQETGDGAATLRLTGDWTTTALGRTPRRLDRDLDGRSIGAVDITALGRFDTAGALALVKAANGGVPKEVWEARPEAGRIYRMIEALEGVPLIVISASDESADVIDSVRAGAKGYILKSGSSALLEHAISLVLSGETYVPLPRTVLVSAVAAE